MSKKKDRDGMLMYKQEVEDDCACDIMGDTCPTTQPLSLEPIMRVAF